MGRTSKSSRYSRSSASTQSLRSTNGEPRVKIAKMGVAMERCDSVTDVISIPLGRHNYSGELNLDDSDEDSRMDKDEEDEDVDEEDDDEEELEDSEVSEAEEVSDEEEDSEDDDEEEEEESDVEDIRGTQRAEIIGVSIPKQSFRRLVNEIGVDESANGSIRFSGDALDILQTEAEKMLVELFTGANANAKAAGRVTVKASDVYSTRLMNEILRKSNP